MAAIPKSGSRAQREALREEMLARGCRHADIAAEMRARWQMRPREAWRHAYGWTLQQLADRVNVPAASGPDGALATDASLVGKWEKWPQGGRRPTARALVLLAEVFGCEVDELLDLDDRRELPDVELRLISRPDSVAEPPAATTAEPAEQVLSASTAEFVHHAAAESATWAQWAEASNVGDIALEQLLSDTRALASSYLSGDPLTVFGAVRALRDRVFSLLEGRQYPRQSTDLYAVAGYLCALLAWISSDLGQIRDADTQGRTAWLCAELSGSNDLRAWVLSTRSKIAFWDGRLREAIGFARRGASYQPQGTAGILLACQEADAWSTLGAGGEAREAIVRAADARGQVAGIDEVAGIFSCSDFRRSNYASAVLLRIGAPAEALRESEEALSSRQPQAYGTAAQVRIVQGFAHLALGEPDGAAQALRSVLALPPQRRLDTLTRRVRELAVALARSPLADSGPGRSLQAEIEAWSLESLPRALALAPGKELA
ncbi:helix-turn-helix transcriptional regulator [Nonomuraea sp. NPDC026600]|uniref:helix-turn-helix domain-containing protein n=1 Tax=Nonomuraea sp. NPDC026600 TaxID=3155363 RepID=UPI0034026B9B